MMMETSGDVHVEAARIQREIKSHLGLRSNALMFEYGNMEGKVKLDLITINPRHNQSFLFHSVMGFDKVDALQKMLEYVKHYKEKESSYTIQWIAKGDKEHNTSYFRASGVYDALDKLYYGRDSNTLTVFSVVLNPVA
ncbi:hypothetical protein LVD15_01345 [Fulvivirga maritima]|uniref:hypothetical protein n=1 Tax=Fulvivirga maritima TaxID=2904247 RepID=UPI001F22EE52|nr:hypothetical protein [Fulvivirga maritima]UII27098.1 hypothetical protein LVD15_01345 [Fulvivirga maritima]